MKTNDDRIVEVKEAIKKQVKTNWNRINDRESVQLIQCSEGKVFDMERYGTEREDADGMYKCNNR